jgi:hypothetical protein
MKTKEKDTVVKDVWEYSFHRASLKRNGKTFALITPDGELPRGKTPWLSLIPYGKLNK